MKLMTCFLFLGAIGGLAESKNLFFDSPSKEIDSSEFGGPPGPKETTCKCGWANKADKRIVGGKGANMHQFPFIASLVTSTRTPFCAGTILTPYHILTAAHCTIKTVKWNRFFAIRVGDHDTSRLDETYFTQEIQMKKIIQHENYDDDTLVNDISLIVLASPIQFNNNVGPACLPKGVQNLDNDYIKVIGWGRTSHNGTASPTLLHVNMRVVPLSKCSSAYSLVSPADKSKICAHGSGKGSCMGDSGGPVVWLDPETNRYVHSGIVSFGRICGGNDPSVFTDTSNYIGWIAQKISESSPSPVKTCSKV